MSLAKRRLAPALDWLESDALLPNASHATQLILIRNINIGTVRGHTYGQSGITINTTGTAIPHLGDSHTMCKQLVALCASLRLLCNQSY